MRFWRGVKRRLRDAVAPCVFLALAGYFLWSATQGERGLNGAGERQTVLEAMKLDVQRAETEKQVWERRVAAMRKQSLDRDALDERVRGSLYFSAPTDIIVMYPQGQRLF